MYISVKTLKTLKTMQ